MSRYFKILFIIMSFAFFAGGIFLSPDALVQLIWPSRVTDTEFIREKFEILYLVPYFFFALSLVCLLLGIYLKNTINLFVDLIERVDEFDTKTWFGIFIIAGLVIRFLWIYLVPTVPVSDPGDYLLIALEMAESGIYPSDYRPVGYPFFLSLIFRIFGNSQTAGLIANAFLNIATILLACRLTYKLSGSKLAAKILLPLMIFFPDYIASSAVFAAEPLFSVLMLGGINVLISDRLSFLNLITVGLIFASAALVRPIFLASFMLIPFILFAVTKSRIEIIKATLVVMFTILISISPWTYRNYLVMDAFVPIAPIAGTNLYMGNNPEATGGYYRYDRTVVEGIESQAQIDNVLTREALKYIGEEPLQFLKMIPYKLYLTYYRDSAMIDWALARTDPELPIYVKPVITIINEVIYHVVLLMTIICVLFVLVRRHFLNPLFFIGFFVVGYLSAFPAIFSGIPRLHYPVLPFMFISVAFVIIECRCLVNRERTVGNTKL